MLRVVDEVYRKLATILARVLLTYNTILPQSLITMTQRTYTISIGFSYDL